MSRLALVLLVPLPLIACDRFREEVMGHDVDDTWETGYIAPWKLNDYGYRTWFNSHDKSDTMTVAEAEMLHAQAVDRAVQDNLTRYSDDPRFTMEHQYDVAKRTRWTLEGNCCIHAAGCFQCLAAGESSIAEYWTRVGFYRRRQGAQHEVDWTYPWTVRQNPADGSQWRWGVWSDGDEYPSLRHELAHHVTGAACFEHKSCGL